MESTIRPHLEAGQLAQARQAIKDYLHTLKAPTAEILAEAAYWSCQANDFDLATSLYHRACSLAPDHATYHYNLATTLRITGDINGAKSALERHLQLAPDDAEAHWLLAQLSTQNTQGDRATIIRQLIEKNLPPKQTVHAWYALGKIYEDCGEFSKSFTAIHNGASLRRRYLKYHPDQDAAIFAQIESAFSQSWFEATKQGDTPAGNIFIVGMPRSGTTLVENLLAAHDQVAMGGELNTFSSCLMAQVNQQAQISSMGDAITQSSRCDFHALGHAYRQATADYQNNQSFLTDKLPLNFLYLGLIHKALPKARILRIERDPMDTVWSIYKHLFSHTYPFSYDLMEIAEYYLGYHKLMTHWENLLGDNLLRVDYEALIAAPTEQTKRITQFCGIEYDPNSLNFYQQSSSVTTGSAVQVRQAMHSRSIGQWQHFAKQLEPVRQRLIESGMILE
ncbi:tetratricopeptide repeat-containing sulfotransferase family protein [Aliiglaciecola litoralis]|uniref:Tetratricopeptide repeat-containing protein n=1 Tax=Aliiglaciecola litoralis TaxID=582857 RepID=A0ABN1LPY9_9ALTE